MKAKKSVLFLLLLSFLSACDGGGSNRNTRVAKDSPSGIITGLTGINQNLLDTLDEELKSMHIDNVLVPEAGEDNGDIVTYEIEFAEPMYKVIGLISGETCRFRYKKITLKNTVVRVEGVDEKITLKEEIATASMEFAGDLAGATAEICKDSLKKSEFIRLRRKDRTVNLEQRIESFKRFIKEQVFDLIEKCKNRGDFSDGRTCEKLAVKTVSKKTDDAYYEGMDSSWRVSFEMTDTKGVKNNITYGFSPQFVHFSYGGLFYQKGLNPLGAKNSIINLNIVNFCHNGKCLLGD